MRPMSAEPLKKVTVTASSDRSYTWQRIFELVKQHKPELIKAHIIAFFAMLATVPLPLLLPILVDEVLLDKPGPIVAFLQFFGSPEWYGPVYYIAVITAITIMLRGIGLGLGVWQMQQFTVIA
ncbi:MAG: ABC transporter ATP-binding protein, partial [Gammaproteobacteria bacterium]|nr:ABC transporter ATP-binding protein [Gammaproteobacteria bacterium]